MKCSWHQASRCMIKWETIAAKDTVLSCGESIFIPQVCFAVNNPISGNSFDPWPVCCKPPPSRHNQMTKSGLAAARLNRPTAVPVFMWFTNLFQALETWPQNNQASYFLVKKKRKTPLVLLLIDVNWTFLPVFLLYRIFQHINVMGVDEE